MEQTEFYKQGAEAILKKIVFDGEEALSKKRVPKNYRNQKLDLEIRKKRTRNETKLLREAARAVKTPRIFLSDEKNAEIVMEFIKGKRLKDVIETKKELCIKAGKQIKKLHDVGIIHGDLTTSNIILSESGELFFIDFGLGYFSQKVEDKATDLVVFKKTFNATHSSLKQGWEKVMRGYEPDAKILSRMEAIEKRARYH